MFYLWSPWLPWFSLLTTVALYANTDFVNEEARMSLAPLATIEIQSPSQSAESMVSKLSRYFEFGVKSCWIVFPALKAIVVYQSQDSYTIFDKDEILKDPVLEIQLEVGKIFQ